jgi:hypothetical protein
MSPVFLSDKRKAARFQVSIPVNKIQCKDICINSHTSDISSDGIGLIMDGELPLDQPFDFNLCMPDTGEIVHVHGKAIWIAVSGPGRYRAGIRFVNEHLKPIPLVLRSIRFRTDSYHN